MMPVSAGASKYSLQVADVLPSIGIMHSMTTGKASPILTDPFSFWAILLSILGPIPSLYTSGHLTLDTCA